MNGIVPLSHWIGFHLFILLLLVAEFLYVRHQGPAKTHSSSIAATVLWVTAALAFAFFILRTLGGHAATQYLAGYAIEEALSIDNLFVFLLLFRLFDIAPERQPRVLFWGVAGAIVMRGAFIAAGLGLLARFAWISICLRHNPARRRHSPRPAPETRRRKMKLRAGSNGSHAYTRSACARIRFFVIEDGRRMATVLFLALVAIEITDLVFALDSIPAVLSITRHPFLAYTSNIMAVMGLRSLYFLLANLLTTLRFLHYGLSAVLAFAALKMLYRSTFSRLDLSPRSPSSLSMLGITIALSLLLPRKTGEYTA